MFRTLLALAFLIAFSLFFIPTISDAQGLVSCGNAGDPACGLCDVFVLLDNIIDFFVKIIVPALAAFFLVLGGFFLLIAVGDPAKVQRGRDVLFATVAGLVVVYTSWLLIYLFLTALGFASFAGFSFNAAGFTISCSLGGGDDPPTIDSLTVSPPSPLNTDPLEFRSTYSDDVGISGANMILEDSGGVVLAFIPCGVVSPCVSTILPLPNGSYTLIATVSDTIGQSDTASLSFVVGSVAKMVFVTSVPIPGDFGGLVAGDVECATRATAAGLGGVWRAWLSSDSVDARSQILDNEYRTVPGLGPLNDKLVFANWADLTNPSRGPVTEIRVNEFGATVPGLSEVWTGTMANGVKNAGATCTGWTSTVGSAVAGDASSNDSQFWTDAIIVGYDCNKQARLYCFEQ